MTDNPAGIGIIVINAQVIPSWACIVTCGAAIFKNINGWIIIIIKWRIIAVIIIVIIGVESNSCICVRVIKGRIGAEQRRSIIIIRIITESEIKRNITAVHRIVDTSSYCQVFNVMGIVVCIGIIVLLIRFYIIYGRRRCRGIINIIRSLADAVCTAATAKYNN
jgi:hypothetical protein